MTHECEVRPGDTSYSVVYTGNVWVVFVNRENDWARQVFTGGTRAGCLDFTANHYPDLPEVSR